MSSSYEPTSATVGHASTGPRSRPQATFAASVPAMPRPSSHRASTGARTAPPCRVKHSHRTGVDEPVHGQRDQTCRPPRLAARLLQGTRMLVGNDRRDSSHPGHRSRSRPPGNTISRCHRAPSASANSAAMTTGAMYVSSDSDQTQEAQPRLKISPSLHGPARRGHFSGLRWACSSCKAGASAAPWPTQ